MTATSTNPGDAEYIDAIRRELRLVRILSQPVIVNWWLVISNVVLFVLAWSYGFRLTDGFGFSAALYQPVQMVFYTGMKVNSAIEAGQWWRIISAMWVHLDFLHIGFNVYGLWVLGPLIEKFYGARRYLTLYMVTGFVAGFASFYFNDVNSGGASGAIYGLVGALLVFGFRNRGALPERVVRGFTTGLGPWVALSIGIGFFDAIPFDNAAHLGGLFSGMLLAISMSSKLQHPRSKPFEIALWIATAACVATVATTAYFWSAEASNCLASGEAYLGCYPELTADLSK